jgi:PAS domain S-box-containing protein
MAADPETVLQKLADTLLVLCRAGSAGVSILEPDAGVFRWRAAAGRFAPILDGTIPRDASPCGVVLDRDTALLFDRPQRHFPDLARIDPPAHEVLLVPFHNGGKSVGTVWAVGHTPERKFDGEDARLLEILSRFASAAYNARGVIEALRASEANLASELADANGLQMISSQLLVEDNAEGIYRQLLDAAMTLMKSDAGSMQVLDRQTNELCLLTWKGFDPESAKFWQRVRMDSQSSCAAVLRRHERIVVADVEACDFMAGTDDLASYRRSGIRAVQSTPLISRAGRLVGMISTHWRRPHAASERELRLLDVIARQAADLLERMQAEETLRETEQRFSLMVLSIRDHAIFLMDPDGKVVSWNEGAQHILGYDADEVLGRPASLFFSEEDRRAGRPEQELKTASETGRASDENWQVRKGGRRFWASGTTTALRDDAGRLRDFVKIFRDLTEKRQAEEKIHESEERLRTALAAAEMGTWLWRIRTNEQILDDSLRRLMGLAPGEEVTTLEGFLRAVHDDDRDHVRAEFERSRREGCDLNIEFRVTWPDGSLHWLRDQGKTFTEADGPFT